MIYSHGVVAAVFVHAVQRAAYRRCEKMAYVKGLGYVYRRIVEAHRFSVAFKRRQRVIVVYDGVDCVFCYYFAVEIEIEIAACHFGFVDERIGQHVFFQFTGYCGRSHVQFCREFETRQAQIAVFFVLSGRKRG